MEIFKLFGSIFVNTDDAEKGISKTDKKASGFATTLGNGIKTAAKWGIAIAAGAAAGAAALYKMATGAAETTDHIDKMSQKIGISRQAYQELDFITSQSGASVDNLKAGMKTLTNQMQSAADGSKTAISAFDELGLSWEDGTGKLKNQETMMWEAFSALQNMDDQTKKAALATDLFGKAGTDLMPMLNGASGSIEEMKQKAHDLGLVLSDESIDAGVKLTDTIDQVKRSFSAIVTQVGVSVMPMFQTMLEWVLNHMPEIQSVMQKAFEYIGLGIGFVVDTAKYLIDTFKKINGSTSAILSTEFVETIKWFINTAFPNMFEHLKNSAVENFKGKLSDLKEIFIKLKDIVQPFAELYITQLIDTFLIAVDLVSSVVIPILGFLFDVFTQIAGTILDSVQPALSSIIDSFSALYMVIYEAISDYIIPTLEMFIDMIKQLWEENQDKINLIGELFKTVFDLIAKKVEWFVGVIQGYIYPLFIWFIETVQSNMDIIKNIFQSVFNMIGGIIQFFIALFKGDWSGMWDAVKLILDGAFSFIKNIFELISAFIGSIGDAIKEKVKKTFENIKTSMVTQISEGKDSVVKIFTAIKNAIEEKIDAARKIVSTGIEKIKGFFNFEWSLPKLKLPHFNISGEFSLKPPSVPSFGVEWYKDGGIMTRPTAFGINPSTGNTMVGGEAGPEAIAPIAVLQEYVKDAVSGQNQDIVAVLNLILQGIYALGERLGILENLQLVLDSGALVGEIANKMDSELGTIVSWKERNG